MGILEASIIPSMSTVLSLVPVYGSILISEDILFIYWWNFNFEIDKTQFNAQIKTSNLSFKLIILF